MGLISWMWGSGDSARPANARTDNPWRRLYNPGMPPNPAPAEGAQYYDNVQGPSSPSVWDQVLKSEEFRRKSFDELDADHDGFVDQSQLQSATHASPPDAARMVKEADTAGRGKISRADYDAVMRGHFGTA